MYIKPAEHAVMEGFASMVGYNVIMKGMNAVEVAADIVGCWQQLKNPVSRSGDASRFDAHTGIEIRRDLEFQVYDRLFPGTMISKLMRRGLSRKVVAKARDGKMTYLLNSRGSGYHNTGVGNCIITSMVILHYMRTKNIRGFLKVNGDDWFCMYEKEDSQKWLGIEGWFCDNGYRLVSEPEVSELESIVFCQAKLVFIGPGYLMVRDPRTCRLKDLITSKVRSDKHFRSWASAVSESGLAMSSGVPILQEFYSCLLRSSNGAKPGKYISEYSGKGRLSHGLTHRRKDVSSDTRYSFYLAFGYTPDEQIALEQAYLNTNKIAFCDLENFTQDSLSVCQETHDKCDSY